MSAAHLPVHLHPVRPANLLIRIRMVLTLAISCLILGSLATFAAPHSIAVVLAVFRRFDLATPATSHALMWLRHIQLQLGRDSHRHPMLHYGADLFAFVELAFALVLISPLRNPVRNQWVIQSGILACCCLIPFALILGPWHGLPMAWRIVSCVVALCGIAPLMLCRHYITLYETLIESVRRRHRQAMDTTLPFPAAAPRPKRPAKPSVSA